MYLNDVAQFYKDKGVDIVVGMQIETHLTPKIDRIDSPSFPCHFIITDLQKGHQMIKDTMRHESEAIRNANADGSKTLEQYSYDLMSQQ